MVPIFSQNLKNCNFGRGFHGNEKKYEKTKCTFNTQFLGLLTNFMVSFRSVTMSAHIFLVFIWKFTQRRGVLLIWIRVGQGPTALAVDAGGGCLEIVTLIYPFSPLSPSLWETTRYRLKYCLKGSLSPKTTNQPNRV